MRDYGVDGQIGNEETPEEYVNKLMVIFREVRRVLADDGTLWLNLGDSYAGSNQGAGTINPTPKQASNRGTNYMTTIEHKSKLSHVEGCKAKDLIGIPWMVAFALRNDGWYLRQDIIWEKGNAMPESVQDRCTRSHEYIFMFSKSKKYYYDCESIKEPAVSGDPNSPRGSKGCLTENSGRRKKQDELGKRTYSGFNERYFSKPSLTTRNKRSVWHINTKPFKGAHFAVFPPELAATCLKAGCLEGGIVLDPFFGSGTVGVVAKEQNKHFIGIDLNSDYCELANSRLNQC